ncbi:MAG: hypothetical protein J5959_06440, partial [Butyrivibrio sp.]|nr:hypothetical protein [Butyrivibrio sp.]
RKIINKKTAIKAIILVLAFIAILSIFPLRVWTKVQSFSTGGELVENSEYINYEYTLAQKFIVQYERLSSVDLYISEVEKGRYITVSVMDENARELLRTYIDTDGYELPGYVNVPLELNAEVGKEYYLSIQACRSKFYVGLEDIPEDTAYVGSLFYDWKEIPARHVGACFNYRLPVDKKVSLMAILVIFVIAGIFITFTELYFQKRPEKNTVFALEKTIRIVANPIAFIVFGTLMIMVFPLKIFDSRAIDIIFYEAGLLISAAVVLYAINHKAVRHSIGISFWQNIQGSDRIRYVLMMVAIAMSIWYASEYMNDLYDIYHTLSERRIMICLLLLIILTFTYSQAINLCNAAWLILSVVAGVYIYRNNALPDTEKEYDLHNLALKYLIIIAVLSGLVLINLVREALERIIASQKDKTVLTTFGVVLILLFAALVIFRNTRLWGIYLVLVFGALYIKMFFWNGKKDWYKILSGGLMLNFAISLGFSLLHRYFPAYVSGRFAFIFHTVTVTAEYLTCMGAVGAVMLVIKVVAFPRKLSAFKLFKSAWKEIVLFGFIMSYAIFTVSRTAYAAIIVSVLLVVIVVAVRNKGQLIRITAVMLVAVLLCFPAAFTLQRIIPTVVADPVFYDIDDADAAVRGGANWDSNNFMCVERFAGLFASKILGIEVGNYSYPDDIYNYDENGAPLYDIYGYPMDNPVEEQENKEYGMGKMPVPMDGYLAAGGFSGAERRMLLALTAGYVDESSVIDVLSNGRITIFKSYLNELNMTGHDTMGALLPNGEIAVHAHNTYLQVAYDNGILTGIVFVMTIICALFSSLSLYRKNEKDDPLTLLTFAITLGFTVAGLTEWVFHFGNPMTIALMLSFAGMIFKEKNYESKEK